MPEDGGKEKPVPPVSGVARRKATGQALGRAGGRVWLHPDQRLHLPDGQVIVADTKWKRLELDRDPIYDMSNADAYQMVAYSQVFQRDQADKPPWLIYPHLPSLPPVGTPTWMDDSRTLSVVTVDLEQEEAMPGHRP